MSPDDDHGRKLPQLTGWIDYPWLWSLIAVTVILGGLLVGYEPVGGDPDRLYRPLKSELARSLRSGHLPFWSDRFGLGMPLVAESQVAAFYPPNWVLYRFLDVNLAYRLAMLAHYLALAATTYAYGRRLGLTPWGGALAALAFTFCGFQAIHSSHEPFYHLLPYMPLALLLAEHYVESGRAAWLALLALVLGAQLALGHFQIQMWTGGLVVALGLWRIVADRRPWPRFLGLLIAIAWAGAVAAAQLVLSWDLAHSVSQTARRPELLAFYSFPPAHWIELALPRFFRGLKGGPEDPYWFGQQTTGFEAALYLGTIPLILAFVGALDTRRGRALAPWRWLVPITFALATLPRWWPQGYFALLQLPGLGYFRCPARYTLLTSLGLALLAGQGLDRAIATVRFRVGLVFALAFGLAAVAWGVSWSARSDFRCLEGTAGLPFGLVPAAVSWLVGLAIIVLWRLGRLGGWAPCLVVAIELGWLYHTSTTRWGWSVAIPRESPILTALATEPDVRRIAGALDDIPVRAGLATGSPYLGFTLPPPHPFLKQVLDRWLDQPGDPLLRRWLRRYGVTHVVLDRPVASVAGVRLETLKDPALDRLAYPPPGAPAVRTWRIARVSDPFPMARVAREARVASSPAGLIEWLSRSDAVDVAAYLAEDAPRSLPPPDARSAHLVQWDGTTAIADHDGTCDLIIARTFDPGWRAQDGEGRELNVARVEGGLQAVRLSGSGRTRVTLRYEPPGLRPALYLSLAATAGALLVLAVAAIRSTVRRGSPDPAVPATEGLSSPTRVIRP